jgi:DNA-binding NarL/FixJ family response regulator
MQGRHRTACLGARGLVFKQEASEVLIRAIKKVSSGKVWLEQPTANLLADLSSRPGTRTAPDMRKMATLTQREREVVMLVAGGLKNKQIAEKLFISEATVSHHLTSIFGKLGVADRLQLLICAYQHGVVDRCCHDA